MQIAQQVTGRGLQRMGCSPEAGFAQHMARSAPNTINPPVPANGQRYLLRSLTAAVHKVQVSSIELKNTTQSQSLSLNAREDGRWFEKEQLGAALCGSQEWKMEERHRWRRARAQDYVAPRLRDGSYHAGIRLCSEGRDFALRSGWSPSICLDKSSSVY